MQPALCCVFETRVTVFIWLSMMRCSLPQNAAQSISCGLGCTPLNLEVHAALGKQALLEDWLALLAP